MNTFAKARRALNSLLEFNALPKQNEDLKMLSAKILINQMKEHGVSDSIHEVEFKVFSQFGDDGIIQYLISNIDLGSPTFVEFGVEDYSESNTRFLLMNNNWEGFVIDGSRENIERIKHQEYYWKYDLSAVCYWITRENINGILGNTGFSGLLGLLSTDVDGNDYWIWECISVVDPTIVIVEYNSIFGHKYATTIPYDPNFNRTKAHPSNLYWGASLKALCLLGEEKDYVFLGSNSSGNNAYFIRKTKLGKIRPITIQEGYVRSMHRESRDSAGRLNLL